MLMKVFQKGQVVIPAAVRRELGIEVGDRLEVELDRENRTIALHKPEQREAAALAGSLAEYARGKAFPNREEMQAALAEGLGDG